MDRRRMRVRQSAAPLEEAGVKRKRGRPRNRKSAAPVGDAVRPRAGEEVGGVRARVSGVAFSRRLVYRRRGARTARIRKKAERLIRALDKVIVDERDAAFAASAAANPADIDAPSTGDEVSPRRIRRRPVASSLPSPLLEEAGPYMKDPACGAFYCLSCYYWTYHRAAVVNHLWRHHADEQAVRDWLMGEEERHEARDLTESWDRLFGEGALNATLQQCFNEIAGAGDDVTADGAVDTQTPATAHASTQTHEEEAEEVLVLTAENEAAFVPRWVLGQAPTLSVEELSPQWLQPETEEPRPTTGEDDARLTAVDEDSAAGSGARRRGILRGIRSESSPEKTDRMKKVLFDDFVKICRYKKHRALAGSLFDMDIKRLGQN